MLKPVAHSGIKLKQNTETAWKWNSFRHVSASLAYFFQHANKYANEAETSLKLSQAVSVFSFHFISDLADVRNKIV